MAGRFGKYGDAKRKSQIHKTRRTKLVDLQKLGRKKSSKSTIPKKCRGA